MLSNITSNSPKNPNDKQASLQGGDQVDLYNDPKYTGMLIRPVDRMIAFSGKEIMLCRDF